MLNYCPQCGQKTQLRYPANNPENGPPEPTCKEHGSIPEFIHEYARRELGMVELAQEPTCEPNCTY